MILAAVFEEVTERIYGRSFALLTLHLPCLPTNEAWPSALNPGYRLPAPLLRWILPLPLSTPRCAISFLFLYSSFASIHFLRSTFPHTCPAALNSWEAFEFFPVNPNFVKDCKFLS